MVDAFFVMFVLIKTDSIVPQKNMSKS